MDDADFSELHNPYGAAVGLSIDGGGGDRFSQWSSQETQDFLQIRAELDPTFMETRRNKLLWEMVSTRMREIGYNRSPQQCKSKWKNLVTRYKGCETLEAEEMRQESFPFYNEMQIIFNARMQRMLWLEAQGGVGSGGGAAAATSTSRRKQQALVVQISSNDEDEDDGNRRERASGCGPKKKRKTKATKDPSGERNSIVNGLKEIMEEFMNQQMEMEMQWMKAYEQREERRRVREMEWRQTIDALESERMMMMNWWREREEQRKIREEARAERRDALITALLNKLRREGM